MSFSRENFTSTREHKKQTSHFHSDVFTRIKSKQVTFTQIFFLYAQKSIKRTKNTKTSNKRLSLRYFLYAQIANKQLSFRRFLYAQKA